MNLLSSDEAAKTIMLSGVVSPEALLVPEVGSVDPIHIGVWAIVDKPIEQGGGKETQKRLASFDGHGWTISNPIGGCETKDLQAYSLPEGHPLRDLGVVYWFSIDEEAMHLENEQNWQDFD